MTTQNNPFYTAQANAAAAPGATQQLAVAGQGGPLAGLAQVAQGPGLNDHIDDVSFDSDIKISSLEKLDKMKLNEVARLAFILFDANNSPMMKRSTVYFDKPQNVIWMAPKNAQLNAACTAKYNEPKQRFGAIVLKYDTDQYGNLMPNGGYDLKAWVFGTDKFPILKQLQKEWGLQNHDLLLTCTEVNFQKITIQPAKDCLFRGNPELAAEIIAKAQQLHERHLPHKMGAFKTDQEIINILNNQHAANNVAGAGGGQQPLQTNAVNPFTAGAANPLAAAGAGVGSPQGAVFADLVASGTQTETVNPAATAPATAEQAQTTQTETAPVQTAETVAATNPATATAAQPNATFGEVVQ